MEDPQNMPPGGTRAGRAKRRMAGARAVALAVAAPAAAALAVACGWGCAPTARTRAAVAADAAPADPTAIPLATGWLDRVNHLNNPANARKADETAATFKKGVAFLDGQLDKNLEARRALETAVNAAQNKVDDTAMAALTTEMTWVRLRHRLAEDLGLREELAAYLDENGQPIGGVDANGRAVNGFDLNEELARRIALRQVRVTAIASVLTLMADAQSALIEQAADDVERARKDLEAVNAAATRPAVSEPPAVPAEVDAGDDAGTATPKEVAARRAAEDRRRDKIRSDRVKWFREVAGALAGAADTVRKRDDLIARATQRQLDVLSAIERSRDPESASALAAVIGTGLDDRSFELLDAYLAELQKRLDALQPPPEDARTVSRLLRGVQADNGSGAAGGAWVWASGSLVTAQEALARGRVAQLSRGDGRRAAGRGGPGRGGPGEARAA